MPTPPPNADEPPDARIAADLEGDSTPAELAAQGRYAAYHRATRAVRAARTGLETAREAVAEADAQQRDAVRQALATGMLSVGEVAEVLGVSRARVYQIRNGRR